MSGSDVLKARASFKNDKIKIQDKEGGRQHSPLTIAAIKEIIHFI